MIALSITEQAADALLTRSLTLVQRLPGTLAALEAGALHPGHLWAMLEKVAPIADDRVRAEVEAELLRWAAGRVTTPAQLGAKARREVLKRDARAAARQLQKALQERGISLRPHTVDGMAAITIVATMPEAQALCRTLTTLAQSLDEPDDPRTLGQKMLDCLLDLVLRPGENDLPPVQVLLTVVASMATLAGADAPGEIDGHVVPAEMIRQLLTALMARQQPPAADEQDGAADGDLALWEETLRAELEAWGTESEEPAPDGEQVDVDAGPLADDAPIGERPSPEQTSPPEQTPPNQPETPCPAPPEPSDATLDPHVTADQANARSSASPVQSPDGRWADADTAVDEASLSLFQAGQKLAHAQRLVRAAVAAEDADEAAWQASPAGRVTDAEDAITALMSTTDAQRDLLAELLSTTGGGGLADRPRIALTDALSGALLALTDLPGLIRAGTCGERICRRDPAGCSHDLREQPGLGPPGPTDGYRPSAELDRWMRARDRRCRAPGCRRRVPRGGELDHHRPYPAGPTSAHNLAGYCTTDHRGKHQAPGWQHQLDPDGTLTVTTPTGLVAVTTPPPY
jgi:hypothetical protein